MLRRIGRPGQLELDSSVRAAALELAGRFGRTEVPARDLGRFPGCSRISREASAAESLQSDPPFGVTVQPVTVTPLAVSRSAIARVSGSPPDLAFAAQLPHPTTKTFSPFSRKPKISLSQPSWASKP